MNNKLNWRVPSRAQSAASVSSTWNGSQPATPPPPAPAEAPQPLWGMQFSPECNDLYFSNRYGQSSAPSRSLSLPSRPASGQAGGTLPRQSSPKRYWELGGLGPTSVATPDWQVHKERWLAKKAYGIAATAANRQARLQAQGKLQQKGAKSALTEPEAIEPITNNIAEEDESAAALEERARKRDIAMALNL